MSRKKAIIALCITALVMNGVLTFLPVLRSYRSIQALCDAAFDQAVAMDLDSRREGVPFRTGGWKMSKDSILVMETAAGKTLHKKSEAYLSASRTEKEIRVIQVALITLNKPVQLERFDSLFRVCLSEQGIVSRTTVTYSDYTGKTGVELIYRRDKNTDVYALPSVRTERRLGVSDDDITLCGYADVTGGMIWRYGKLWFWVQIGVGVALVALLLFVLLLSRPVKKAEAQSDAPDEMPLAEADVALQLDSEPYAIDEQTLSVVFPDGQRITLTSDPFKLFELLHRHIGEIVTYQEITDYMYSSMDIHEFKHRLLRCIQRLRESFSSRSEISINNFSRVGYRLRICPPRPHR